MKFVLTEDYKADDDTIIQKDYFVNIVPFSCYNNIDELCMDMDYSYSEAKFMMNEFFEIIYSKTKNFEDSDVITYSDCIHYSELADYLKEHRIEVVE